MTTKVISTGIQYSDNTIQTTAASDLGINQTWQNLTGSRALGVTYTNDTIPARPIYITVQVNSGNNGSIFNQLTISSINLGKIGWDLAGGSILSIATLTVTGIVPAGAQYYVTAHSGNTLVNWLELR